jgi:5-methylthioadenosine/S-adenosylhomocysteine deaminase
MPHCDIIIKKGTILTMDRENAVLDNGFLCIRDDAIFHIGTKNDNEFKAAKEIDAKGGLVLPGLVNGNTRGAMSLFRGLGNDLPGREELNRYMSPLEGRMNADFVFVGALLACAEMILSGTTTFCDTYLFEDQVARAARKAKMRCLVGEVLSDSPSPNYGSVEKGIAVTESLIKNWQDDPTVSIAVAPHSASAYSPEMFSIANDLAKKHNVPLIIDLAETLGNVVAVEKRYGKRPIEHLRALGILGPGLIAAHCVHLNETDIKTMAAHGVRVVHNPVSNMKLASGIAPVPEMIVLGIPVGLGTDGCAVNNNLDLFTEMDMAAKLQKVRTMDPTVMDAVTVLRLATIQGAAALGMGNITGSLEIGKKADIIIVDTDKPHLTPLYNPFSHLVYAARGNDVSHSIINGRLVMDDRKLLFLDLDEIIAQTREKASQVKAWLS